MKFTRYKRTSETSYAEGATLVFELLKTCPDAITQIFLRPLEKYGEDILKIIALAKEKDIKIFQSNKPFNVLGTKDACILIAEFQKQRQKLDSKKNHLLLVNPSDAGNLGTIIRTAAAFNLTNIGIITPAVDHFDPKVVRASMGALFHLNIQEFPNYETYKAQFPNQKSYAFMLNNKAKTISDAAKDKDTPFTLVMGNEAAGLPKEYENFCTPVYIPQSNMVDSLNLSIATALAMYEFTK